jgi:hypothetical protein
MNAVAKKLMMRPGQRWLLYNAPNNYLAVLEPLPDNVSVNFKAEGEFNGIQLFVLNREELVTGLKHIQPVLKQETLLWIIYPKKSSGIESDLEMMGSWTEPAKYGLKAVAAAAIDDTWTALRFRPEGQSKVSATRNSEVSNSEYAAYIDVANKKVTLPPEIEAVLTKHPLAYTNFQKLSYSNKKEYVLWVISAKQEKTKAERLPKMVDKLINGKKNPSEK